MGAAEIGVDWELETGVGSRVKFIPVLNRNRLWLLGGALLPLTAFTFGHIHHHQLCHIWSGFDLLIQCNECTKFLVMYSCSNCMGAEVSRFVLWTIVITRHSSILIWKNQVGSLSRSTDYDPSCCRMAWHRYYCPISCKDFFCISSNCLHCSGWESKAGTKRQQLFTK